VIAVKFRVRQNLFMFFAAAMVFVAGCKTTSLPNSQRVEPYYPKVAALPPVGAENSAGDSGMGHQLNSGMVSSSQSMGSSASHPRPVAPVLPAVKPAVKTSDIKPVSQTPSEAPKAVVGKPENPGQDSQRSHNVLRKLRSGDRVTISLRGIPDGTAINDVIDGWGEVTLPFIGEIKIVDKTLSEAERLIEKSYVDGGIYRNINVIVVAETEFYFVQGEVAKQGKFALSGKITLQQAISEAGGYTPFAKKTKIKVTRGNRILVFNGKDIEAGKVADPQIMSNDIINVVRRRVF
jgi:protein involved in polysaccharide export with SLBB domain